MLLRKSKLNLALLATITTTFGSTHAYSQVQEIVVTSTKRVQSAQSVPVAVQALDGAMLEDLNVSSFDDYLRFLPNVTAGGRGPGQNSIYVRGMATDTIAVHLAGSNGSAPNVALYLDEQPVTVVGRNLDVYITDVERVEVLPGPQGTLFGASSQAGTVRLITNKPVLNEFRAGFDASVATTRKGSMSNSTEAYINIPVIDDKLAVRGAFFSAKEGGYIDNVFGEKRLSEVNPAFPVGADAKPAVNTDLVEDDFNDATYDGFRIGAKYNFNTDWDLLVTHMRQNLTADGVFDFDPEIGDLKVQRFSPDRLKEKWNQTSWTLEGRLAALDVLYTGAFLDRDVDQVIDYTGYADVGPYIPYYICEYPSYATCEAPNLASHVLSTNRRHTHEIRVNTPEQYRWKLTAGVFYDRSKLEEMGDFIYFGSIAQGFAQNAPFPGATSINPNPRDPGVVFFNDITRTEEQYAVFGELSYELIPHELTATFGMRYFNLDVGVVGSANSSFSNRDGIDRNEFGANLDETLADVSPLTEEDVIFKGNLTWTPTDNLLFYATYSEGFRPGGFNRGALPSNTVPKAFRTDNVRNYEIGWKTEFLNRTLRFNGAAYFVEWTGMQVSLFDPVNFGTNLTFIDNGADSEIYGIEGDVTWAPNANWLFQGSFSFNDTKLTDIPDSAAIQDFLAPVGSELAMAPPFQGNVRARYNWFLDDYKIHAQAAFIYTARSFSSVIADDRFRQNDWATVDLAAGVTHGRWGAELFVENLTDTRAQLFINTQDDTRRTTTNRPRTMGLRVSFDY